MSRWAEERQDERGRYIVETLKDADGCRWEINEVCCNDASDEVCEFVYKETCEGCKYFECERDYEIEELKDGKRFYE